MQEDGQEGRRRLIKTVSMIVVGLVGGLASLVVASLTGLCHLGGDPAQAAECARGPMLVAGGLALGTVLMIVAMGYWWRVDR